MKYSSYKVVCDGMSSDEDKCILHEWQVPEGWTELHLHMPAFVGWRGLLGNLAWAGPERDPLGIPAEHHLAANRRQM